RVRVEYTGIGIDSFCPEEPMKVPLFARIALIDFVTIKALEHRIYTEGKGRLFTDRYRDKKDECYGRGGTWQNALMYWGQMDDKQRGDLAFVSGSLRRIN